MTAGNSVRVGTWNLDGGWGDDYAAVITRLNCDVLLLTEVHFDVDLPGYHWHTTTSPMGFGKHWSAIFSRWPLEPLPDPHPASAAARINGTIYISSVLPWPLANTQTWPFGPADRTERLQMAVDELDETLSARPVVWGGDWNQPLEGNIQGFVAKIQTILLETATSHGLQVPTRDLTGRNGQKSIDHLAIPTSWTVRGADRIEVGDLSDHDAYWVEIEPK